MPMFGKGVEYALHCLIYLVGSPPGAPVSVADIAEFQGVSETYLAKIFARLKHNGIVRASKGINGGYELAKSPSEITFWNVAVAVEGDTPIFECHNVREHCVLYQGSKQKPKWMTSGMCLIHKTMLEAETQMQTLLKSRTLEWLCTSVAGQIPESEMRRGQKWFGEHLSKKFSRLENRRAQHER